MGVKVRILKIDALDLNPTSYLFGLQGCPIYDRIDEGMNVIPPSC
jgi:hypothetical protein